MILSLREGEEPSRWAFEGFMHRGGSAGCRGADLLEGELCTAALLIYPQAVFFSLMGSEVVAEYPFSYPIGWWPTTPVHGHPSCLPWGIILL